MQTSPEGDFRTPRAVFLKRTLLVGGAAVASGVVAGSPIATSGAATRADARALDLLLLVEYTESAFYAEALDKGSLGDELKGYAREVAGQERQHLEFVKKAIGAGADPEPDFDFGGATGDSGEFAAKAAQLEDLAVAAYNGQATNVTSDTLAAAATIVSVEARHAAWVRSIVGRPPAPDATDKPQSGEQVLAGLSRIGLKR